MKILQAHKFYWPRDGASNYALMLGGLLAKRGHTIIPFAMRHANNLPSPHERFFVSELDLSDAGRLSFKEKLRAGARILYSTEARRNIARLLDEYPVDAAHLHNIYHHISPSILLEFKKRRIPVVMTLHDWHLLSPNYNLFHHGAVHEEDAKGWYLSCLGNRCVKNSRAQSVFGVFEMIVHHKLMKYYERMVDRFISPSRFLIDTFVRHGWPRERFVHVTHPVGMQNAECRMQNDNDGQTVLYAGRLSEEKGLGVLLDVAKRTPALRYVIAGTGPMESKLKERARTEKIANVVFAGYRTGDALASLFQDARVLISPSICYDVYPLSVLEGKAMGKIVIGSNIGGIPELLPPELLVTTGDPAALAEKITDWYNRPSSERRRMGESLRQEVRQENDAAEHIRRIEALYRGMMNDE